MFVYASHHGGFFVSKEWLTFQEVYCVNCGGYDKFLGAAKTKREARGLIDGSGLTYNREEVEDFLEEYFGEQGESEV